VHGEILTNERGEQPELTRQHFSQRGAAYYQRTLALLEA